MAKQTINLGTSANKGDGDPLRTAFDKVNDNFDELYARDLNTDAQTLALVGDTLSISDGNSVDLSAYLDDTQFSGDYDDLTNKPDLTNRDLTGSVFGDDSTLLVDGVNSTIPASVVDGTITNDILTNSLATITDIQFGTYADVRKPKIGITGIGEHDIAITAGYDISGNDSGNVSINANTDGVTPGIVNIANSSGKLSLGKIGGSTDVYGEVEFNSGTTLFQAANSVDFNCDVDFNDVVKFAKTTTTGADDNPTLTLIDVNSSGVQVLTSNDNTTNNWELPDGSEGQIMHFVAGGAGGSGANHKIKINNWWKRDGDTGVWSSGSGYWDVFAIYGFAGRTDTGMATAIFVDGAWRTTSPWVD